MKKLTTTAVGGVAVAVAAGLVAASGVAAPSVLRCPGAKPAAKTAIDGSWRRDFPRAAWLEAGFSALDWETNGGRHTLTFDRGVWRDEDDVVGEPPDACGPYVLEKGVVSVYVTAEIDANGPYALPKMLLFRVRASRSKNTLRLVPVAFPGRDPMAVYLFSGTWTRLG